MHVWLNDYRNNIYSQNGEDGVIAKILSCVELPSSAQWCVEFGAWDGRLWSNTFALISESGWNAVMIEGDTKKFGDLVITAKQHPKIVCINAFVGTGGEDGRTLDELLAETDVPRNYGVLSIDIDSNDLEVWASHNQYKPAIVIIEINSSLAPVILQWNDENTPGSSFSSTLDVARRMAYSLVCHTGNMIFLRNDLLERIPLDPLDLSHPERLFDYRWVSEGKRSVLNKFLARILFKLRRIRG